MNRNFFEKLIYGGGIFFDLAKWIIFIGIIFILINTFFVSIFLVDGPSMEPNFHDREVGFYLRKSIKSDELKRGDVVLVRYPGDPEKKKYVKRVVGLPGEKLEIRKNAVYINDKKIDQPYLPVYFLTEPDGVWNMKENEYFAMGDNRENSNDSRFFGPIEKRFVLGQALAVIFPRFLLVRDM